jgi:ABC-type phosphate/phosphonate transport system substrate-binding protein
MLKRTLALAAAIALSTTSLLTQASDVLRVSAIPDEAPTELLRKFAPSGGLSGTTTGHASRIHPGGGLPGGG